MKKRDTRLTLRKHMFGIIQSWQQSDISQRSFCHKHKISYWKFKYWHYKYRKVSNHRVGSDRGTDRDAGSIKGNFIPVELKNSRSDERLEVKILFPNGVCVECSSFQEVDQLASLIKQF